MLKLRKFFCIPFKTQTLLLKALVLLPFCQLCVNLLHFKYILKLFQLNPGAPTLSGKYGQTTETAHRIEWIISKALSVYSPTRIRCLAQALTAYVLLRREGEVCVILIGASIEKDGMFAHAWLQCGEVIVTGQSMMNKYKKIASFTMRSN